MSGGVPGMPGFEPGPDGAFPPARRAYRVPMINKTWLGWTPDAAPGRVLPPRCGRVLALDGRYERAGWPGDPGSPPVCGRPDGHRPPCRSEAAVARALLADADRAALAAAMPALRRIIAHEEQEKAVTS